MKIKILIGILLFVISLPFAVFAQDSDFEIRPGTSDYLRFEMNYSDEQLQTVMLTEGREAFDLSTGEGIVEDPFGDVLNRGGAKSRINAPWGDIKKVEVRKNNTTQNWDVTVQLGGLIPENPTHGGHLRFYADRDGDTTNNKGEGVGINADAEWSIKYQPEHKAWETDFRWHNPGPDFWAVNLETEAFFEIEGASFYLHIPFEEISTSTDLNWRAIMAIQDGGDSQVDAAPGIGFPPPKGEAYPEKKMEFKLPEFSPSQIVLILTGSAVIAYIIFLLLKKRKK